MLKRYLRAAATAVLLVLMTGTARADTTDTSAAAQMAYFVGSWDCNGSFPSTGKTIASTILFETDAKLGAIVKHHDDLPPNSYHALEVWVFSATDHQYNSAIVDNFGGVRRFTSPGWVGDQLTWSNTSSERPARAERFVYVKESTSAFKLDWQVSTDGVAYRVGDTLTCKAKPR
jgi:hypothetical protein